MQPALESRAGAAASLGDTRDRREGGPRVLLLIPSYVKHGIEQAVREDRHPRMDYWALQGRLGAAIADYAVADADTRPLVRLARRAGRDAALAAHAFLERGRYDVIYSNGENVSIPLGALLSLVRARPGHVLIGHHLSTPKKRLLLRRLHRHMDAVFVYASTQRTYAVQSLGMPADRVRLIPFHADHCFYRPMAVPPRRMICSAGLEWRDYHTLIDAVRGVDVEVRLAAASPWSRHADETAGIELPPNVTARRYDYADLRQLYAEALFVVVPLYENDFQAGVTTILEAMSMGKAVIATRTLGQRDAIRDGVDGLYVPPGDAVAMRHAIDRLLGSPLEAARMGAEARRAIEANMTLDHWVDRICAEVRRCQRGGAWPAAQPQL